MMNMNIIAVVTPPSIYHGCFTWKTLWEIKFTVGEFAAVSMKNCRRRNVWKHIDIKNSDKYVTLYIALKFGSLNKMRITSSDPKDNLGRSVKGADYLSGYQGQRKAKEGQKGKVCHQK